jgi:signal transduction histidine kinase
MPEVADLDGYELNHADFDRLLVQANLPVTAIAHDLNNTLHGISGSAELLEAMDLRATNAPERVAEAARRIRRLAVRSSDYLQRIRVRAPVDDTLRPIVRTIVMHVVDDHGRAHVDVDASSPSALRILFPQASLYVALNELVQNALVHGGARAVIGWVMDGDALMLSVHDPGKSLAGLLNDRLRVLPPEVTRRGGLAFLERIAVVSRGMLLARQSPLTGGSEIVLRLPLVAYCQRVQP